MPLTPLHVIVPVRSLSDGKRRLGAAVDAEEREVLIVGMLRSALDVLTAALGERRVGVVSADQTVLAVARHLGTRAVEEVAGGDLNTALLQARAWALSDAAEAVLYLPADLPLLAGSTLARLLDAADAALTAGAARPIVVIAPSDARAGTNALLVAPADVIEPSFGPSSLAAHLEAAARVGATVQLFADAELGFDLDTPEDLERLAAGRLVELLELGARTLDELRAPITPAA